MACYCLFHSLQARTSQNVLTYKFTLNQLLQRSASVIIKRNSFFELQMEAKWYYKVGEVLQSRVIFITKWGNNYKVVQCRELMKETGEIDFANLLLHSTLKGLLRSWNSVIIKRKKKAHTHHRRICVLVSLRNNYLEVCLVLNSILIELLQNL